MSGFNGAVKWAGDHPVMVAVGVFGIGAIILLMMQPKSSGGGDNGMGAFYAAQSAQAASGNSLMAIQEQSKAAVALGGIAADRDKHIADTASATNIAVNTVQAQTDVNLAQINADLAQYSIYKDTRLATQMGDHAYYLSYTKDDPTYFATYLAALNGR